MKKTTLVFVLCSSLFQTPVAACDDGFFECVRDNAGTLFVSSVGGMLVSALCLLKCKLEDTARRRARE